jgi:hypothetical protein
LTKKENNIVKRIVLVPMAVLILCACEDATQPVGVDEPSVLLSKVSDARCIDLPDGNVSWWPGDGHIFDVGDVNHGFPTSDLGPLMRGSSCIHYLTESSVS